jgi:hypothetical protein
MATSASADVFSPAGEFLGSIAAPRGTHGVAFGGKDKKTLFGIVFYGGWAVVCIGRSTLRKGNCATQRTVASSTI